ncbi:MAG: hypothetical protein NC200_08620, partial [Candidatus Gastranaerophilales bacterium]|nr:hypothetical protein [Candidatus Gastranaerophilales bacterium]
MNKRIVKTLILTLCLFSTIQVSFAIEDFSTDNITSPVHKKEYGKVQYNVKEFKKNTDAITNKFVNLNIQSAYDDMTRLILDNEGNDYYLMLLADKATSLGFFDLANVAFSKVSDYEIASVDSENTHKLYFPRVRLTRAEVIDLAEAFSNIQYNDRSREGIKDIQDKIQSLLTNDYEPRTIVMSCIQ